MAASMGLGSKALNTGSSAVAPSTRSSKPTPRSSHVAAGTSGQKEHKGRWKGMDAGMDASDDQQDIARGRGMVDELFQGWGGTAGTQNAIMSSQDYLSQAQRSFGNIEDGFYISPAFLDKLSIHIAKNFMNLPKIKVPLILGIWGGKGQGKTFQCMLAFKKLGITPIVMSAGELESGNAGEPAKLIRQRYREASDQIKKGKMCALFINDLDAGAGRFGMSTQYTVNNQMVNATLMNIADNPTNVQLPGVYKNEEIPRVPIICTGNDFSTLYAPLIRDGRMEKYYWNPTREDRIGVCMGIFMEDGLTRGQVEEIVDAFPGQSIDFFGALRARVYDDKVREFVESIGHENLNKRLVNSKEGKVVFEKPKMGIEILMAYGKALVSEQDNVKRVQLADAYLGGAELAGSTGSSVPEQYEGAKGLKLDEQRRSWRSTPETPRASAPQQAPAPARESYTPPAPAAPASSERWSRTPASSPAARGGSAGGRTLSASDLAAFKIADLAEIGRKKGVSGGRDATRQSLTDALIKAGVSTSDLSKGQLAELNAGGSSSYGSSSPAPSSYTPAAPAAAPAASSGGDRWASYSRGGSSSSGGSSSAPARGGGAGALSAGDLSSFKIVDLVEIAGKKGVSAGRNATRESLTDSLVKAGVTLEDLNRGQLVDLATKLGKAGLSRDLATARSELASLVGGSGSAAATWRATPAPTASSGGSGGSPPASWRSSGSSGSSSASSWRTTDSSTPASASGGDRWAKYSTGASASGGASNVWRRSGSHNASGSKLSAGDLAALRIDDLRDLVKKTGAQLPREPTKDSVISGLVAKGVSLNDLTRGMLVDLSSKLGVALGRDVDTMRKNLASAVGSSGGYSPAPAASSAGSSWRTPASSSPASSSSSGGDRWANYSRSSGGSSSSNGSAGAGGLVSERDLSGLKIDTLSELARKKGISMRNATKQDLISQLSRVLKTSDLSKGQAAEIAAASAAPSGGRRW